MTQSSTDSSLVERLRANSLWPTGAYKSLTAEAADELTALTAKISDAEQRIAALMSERSSLIATKAEQLVALTKRATAAEAKVARMGEALEWYGERARLARLIHSGGDPARFELSDDGGKRARAALQSEDREGGE
jgi:hypothetical protein